MRQNAKLLSQILDSLQRYDPKSHHLEQTQFVNSLGCAGLKISPAFDLDRRGPDGPSLAAPSRPNFDGGKGLKKPPRYYSFLISLTLALVVFGHGNTAVLYQSGIGLFFVLIAELELLAIVPSCSELTGLTILIA